MRYTILIACALGLCIAASSALLLVACGSPAINPEPQQKPSFAHAQGSPITVACGPENVVLGDMNQDGKLDLIVACGKPPGMIVLLGNGDGQFRPASKAGQSNPTSDNALALKIGPGNMVVGDVNGDGKLDVAYDNHDSYAVTLLLGDGNGGFAFAPTSPIMMKAGNHPHTHGLGIGDLNGDKKLDLVSVNNEDNDVSVAFGDGRGGFANAPGSPFAVGPSPYPLALGDVNNDGRPDIVATASATGPRRREQLPQSRAVTLLLNDGRGGFGATRLPIRTGEPWSTAIGDVNGDRKADIVVTHHDLPELTVLFGDGRGGFVEANSSPFDVGGQAFQVAIIDVNRDGKPDAIAAAGESVRVMLGDGQGSFSAAPSIQTGGGTWHFHLGDTNRDGKLDLVTTDSRDNSVTVLLGQ